MMKPKYYFWCALSFALLAVSIGLVDDDRDDDFDTDGDDEDSETAPPVATPTRNACPRAFGDRCTCGRSTLLEGPNQAAVKRYVTNCTNSAFKDATVLKSLPVGTEILIFTGNNISELPQNLFGNDPSRPYEKLKTIDLSNNNINSIHGKTFHNVRNVTKLILDNNHLLITGNHFHSRIFSNFGSLEELSLRNAFGDTQKGLNFMEDLVSMLVEANLSKLKILRLDNNTIQTIPNPEVFCSLESLQHLHLSSNYLTEAKINTTCFKKLRVLDISDNFIVNFNNETLAMFEKPKGTIFHVNMTRNPFKCDCEFLPFFRWQQSTKTWVVGNKNFRCATGFPPVNVGKTISYMKDSDFQCPDPTAEEMSGYVTASYVVLISLSVALVVLIGALIFSTREHISRGWAFVSNSFAAKREYTSLEQDSKRVVVQQVQIEVEEAAV